MNTPQMKAYAKARSVARTGASWKNSVILILLIHNAQCIIFGDEDTKKKENEVSQFDERCIDSTKRVYRFVE